MAFSAIIAWSMTLDKQGSITLTYPSDCWLFCLPSRQLKPLTLEASEAVLMGLQSHGRQEGNGWVETQACWKWILLSRASRNGLSRALWHLPVCPHSCALSWEG